MRKRLLSLALAVCMLALLALPAGAAETARFTDVQDPELRAAAESLRLLGAMDGYSDGTLRPGTALDRAQFCKMLAGAMNKGDELGMYSTVTVFPDVKPSHWAAAYINMAARRGVIAGYPDGLFHPERTVTLGQAVTILLRLLGYEDKNIGGVWPASYVAMAAQIGLIDSADGDGNAPLTRGQAALLFTGLLRADTKEGSSYLGSIAGSVKKDLVLVSTSAKTSDGSETGFQLAGETAVYQLPSGKASSGALDGRRGTLALDKNGRVLTFVPESWGRSRTVTLSGVKADQIVDAAGTSYSVTSATKAYWNGSDTSWGSIYTWIGTGASATLYLGENGGVEYIFVGGGSSSSAVVVYQDSSTVGFSDLAGGNGYQLYKNGAPAIAKDMRRYDVATYSAATNTIQVCDVRVEGVYEKAAPDPRDPETITVMGHDFPILSSAKAEVARFKAGDQVVLLLTEDDQVAGIVSAKDGTVRGNAVGICQGGSVKLLCGVTVSGTLASGSAADLTGQLVRVSSSKAGQISVTRLSGGASGDLDVAARTLGGRKLADNAVVYRITDKEPETVILDRLDGIVPSGEIAYARTNWAGKVDLIVLGTAVGSVIYYGRASMETVGDTGENTLVLDAGGTTMRFEKTGYRVSNGSYVGISAANGRIASLVQLTERRDVPNTAWTGQSTVLVGGRSYRVPSGVLCWNADAKAWVTLAEAHAYAEKCDVYIYDGAVRAIEVKR